MWTTRTLGDVCDEVDGIIQTGPFGSQLHESDYVNDGIPVVMPKNILDGKVDTSDIAFINQGDADRLERHKMSVGDIVYGRRGDIGRRALVGPREHGWLCGTGCLRGSLGDRVLDPTYLYYFLGQPMVVSWIANHAVGATMPNLNTGILRSVAVRYPRLPIQRRIASILSAYDDLIENNTRRFTVLENMAQMLYREWFVNFRFPGHRKVKIVDSELGPIPEGWRIGTMGDLLALKSGFAFKSSTFHSGGQFGLVTIRNVHDGYFSPDCQSRIAEPPPNLPKFCTLQAGDVLMSLTGNIGRTCLVYGRNLLLNQRVAKVMPNRDVDLPFVYFLLRQTETQTDRKSVV